jgi:O-antigen ligase
VAQLGWRPGRGELWRIALSMWRSHPLLGVGPDNFRWLYGRQAGEPFWDTRVFANNTLLEAAATTGSLGLAALALTLAAALFTSYRGFERAPDAERLALLGLTVAVLAHGLVDYTLAFTGHYLFFGFLIGSVAGRGQTDLA